MMLFIQLIWYYMASHITHHHMSFALIHTRMSNINSLIEDDDEAAILTKIRKAFCPEKEVHYNPILNWVEHLLFWNRQQPFRIERKEEHGGDVEFTTYKELQTAFAAGDVHPLDLKATVAKEIIALLAPARAHFAQPEIAAKKQELLEVSQKKK